MLDNKVTCGVLVAIVNNGVSLSPYLLRAFCLQNIVLECEIELPILISCTCIFKLFYVKLLSQVTL